jgi:hypothetical protein
MLPDFVAHKESLGYVVSVITEKDFGGGIGDEAAENIRAWLQGHYISDNIEYVLLIGDPRTDTGEIPMKILWPEHREWIGTEDVPSDLYYADLTGNWDLDGDGDYGEWEDDFGTGGVDRHSEVMVGRIPCYKSGTGRLPYAESVKDLDEILEKTIDYEEKTLSGQSLEWRKSVLLAMNLGVGSCLLGEAIKDDILVPAEWRYHRVYYEICLEGCNPEPPPETTKLDESPCWDGTVPEIWGSGKFGLVVWAAHGAWDGASCLVYYTQLSQLNDEYPSFTFQVSCYNAEPEQRNNIAYELLKQGAICTVAATRQAPFGSLEPFATSSNSGAMGHGYASRLVAGMTSGQALHGLRSILYVPSGAHWKDFVAFNIHGDPSLTLVAPIGRTTYVDSYATGNDDGSSWSNAFKNLQDALAIALPGDEIRVAQGIYKSDQGTGINSGDREASFHLKNGVKLKGGYAGAGASDPNLRDIRSFETILSGDLSRRPDSDSYHVVRVAAGVCEASVLDGFTITGGYADSNDENSCGGGIYIDQAHPRLIDCSITLNVAADRGGGIYNHRGSPLLTGCTFSENSSLLGGGMYNRHATPRLSNTKFVMNVASNGGGIYNFGYGEPVLSFCEFHENSAVIGGGMFNAVVTALLANCIFSRNQADWYGGGTHEAASATTLLNCTFSSNSAVWGGGAVHNFQGSRPRLTNCILWGDTPDEIFVDSGEPSVSYSNVQGGWYGETNVNSDPNFAEAENGDVRLKSQAGRWDPVFLTWVQDNVSSPCIDAGDIDSPIGAEPEPNSGRINMGAFGGTAEASKSP